MSDELKSIPDWEKDIMDEKDFIYFKVVTHFLEEKYPEIFKELHEFTAVDHFRHHSGREAFWYLKKGEFSGRWLEDM